jgi:hypothetical protein
MSQMPRRLTDAAAARFGIPRSIRRMILPASSRLSMRSDRIARHNGRTARARISVARLMGSACATPNAYFIAANASTTGRLLTLIMPPPG